MDDEAKVAEVARGLSRHQRAAIRAASGVAVYPPDLNMQGCVFVALEKRCLANCSLGERRGGSTWQFTIKKYALTPLGLAVRQYLMENPS